MKVLSSTPSLSPSSNDNHFGIYNFKANAKNAGSPIWTRQSWITSFSLALVPWEN